MYKAIVSVPKYSNYCITGCLRYMAVTPIQMPALSPTMEMGNVGVWHKKVGESISAGEAVCEIETDKAMVEYEAQDDGILGKIVMESGAQSIAVGEIIGYMIDEMDEMKDIPESSGASLKSGSTTSKEESNTANTNEPVSSGEKRTTPAALFYINTHHLDLSKISPSGPGNRILKRDVLHMLSSDSTKSESKSTTTTKKSDSNSTSTKKSESKPTLKTANTLANSPSESYTDIPLTAMRKVIASRLTESKQTIPHGYATASINMDSIAQIRSKLVQERGIKVSVNDFIVRACAKALENNPTVNSGWDNKTDSPKQFNSVDISVAVSTPGGLITPIVTQEVCRQGLQAISADVRRLAGKARAGKLLPEEYQGGSFTISNLGMYGIDQFCAVINPPQSCILAVSSSTEHVALGADGKPRNQQMMKVTLSYDRRVVDELVADAFLCNVKDLLQDPSSMLL